MNVAIIGATAYTSYELVKLLVRHPEARIVHLGGRREGAPPVSEIFPGLKGICEMPIGGMSPDDLSEEPDVVFFALPHGVSHKYVPGFLASGIRCIDLSADYRFKSLETYTQWYGEHADKENFGTAAYGIPELFREQIRDSLLVANPGCYPAAALLALAPLVEDSLIETAGIIIDAKSGVSGRGNKPDKESMYCECNENVEAYKVGCHRHEPEIEEVLQLLGAEGASVCFAPHLVPMDRGIQESIYVQLTKDVAAAELHDLFRSFYSTEPFVRVRDLGRQPRTKDVAFTNYCDLGVAALKGGRALITAAIDNLLKGASSQAVQNMNAMLGLDEALGLC